MTPAKNLPWFFVTTAIMCVAVACGSDKNQTNSPTPDTTPPTLNTSTIDPILAKHGQQISVTVYSPDPTATGVLSIADSSIVPEPGQTLEDGSLTFTFTVDDSLADGPHSLLVVLTDDADNASEELQVGTFTVDSTPPTVLSIGLGTSEFVKAGGEAFLTLLTSESITNETIVTVVGQGTMQKVQAASALPAYSYDVTGEEPEGLTQIVVTAFDAAGNSTESGPFDGFYIDYTPPDLVGEATAPSSSVSLSADDFFEFFFEPTEPLSQTSAEFALGETEINLLIEPPVDPDTIYRAYRPLDLCNLCAVGTWTASATLIDAAGNANDVELGMVELVE